MQIGALRLSLRCASLLLYTMSSADQSPELFLQLGQPYQQGQRRGLAAHMAYRQTVAERQG